MWLLGIIFIFFPIIGLPIYIFSYFSNKNKKGILYSILLGLVLGILAYYFIPPSDYDLYRHQYIVRQLANRNFAQFLSVAKIIDLEFLPLLYSYMISLIKNIDLLQFFVVSLGYTILFYMLYDYRKISQLKLLPFTAIVMFTIFGFHALYFISGLYFYIAIIILAFALYNEYVKENKKIISYLLYISVLFIHNAMFFPIAILLIYKIFHNRFNVRSVLTCLSIFVFAWYVLFFVNSILDLDILKRIMAMYDSYISSNDRMQKFYSGTVFFIEITKWLITLLCIFLQKEKNKTTGINGYILLLSLCTLMMIPRSIVMIRFVMLIQFLGIVAMMDSLRKVTRNRFLLLLLILGFALLYTVYFYHILSDQDFGNLFNEKITNNIFNVMRK